MKTINSFLTIGLVSLIISLSAQTNNYQADSNIYRSAIQDAMYPEQSKVYNGLIPINKSNKELQWKRVNGTDYILVVVWMRKKYIGSYEPFENQWGFYNTGEYPMWVTAAPQMMNRMKKENPKDPEYRLKQLLGLSPAATYDFFIEIWVNPEDLIRPCPDPETNDTKCDVCFSDNVNPAHKEWINNNRISSYYNCGLFNQVPWTALGYTYDWNPTNKNHIGLSEFIIPQNTNVVIEKIYTNQEYFTKMK